MNRKGFATILSLCLLLAMALVVRGIQISERNHVYESATDFTAEFELQNAADSALITAVEKIRNEIVTLPKRKYWQNRSVVQIQLPVMTIDSERLDTITVKTWGEKIDVRQFEVTYGTNNEDSDTATKNNIAEEKNTESGNLVFSVAEAINPQTGEKIYRRAVAYFKDDDTTIHYMDVKQSNYKFKYKT